MNIRLHQFLLPAVAALVLVACAARQQPQVVGPIHSAVDPNAVTLYFPGHIPAHYQIIAKLDSYGLGGFSRGDTNRRIVIELWHQAAKLGATGLLLLPVGKGGADSGNIAARSVGGGAASPSVKAYAIYVAPADRDAPTSP
ncbi:MAG: hypothetical protein ACRER1_05445 [Gammaproteobacteria bacterium]